MKYYRQPSRYRGASNPASHPDYNQDCNHNPNHKTRPDVSSSQRVTNSSHYMYIHTYIYYFTKNILYDYIKL